MSLSGFPALSARAPRLPLPGSSRQYYRNASCSPTRQQQQHLHRQHVDDLISQLTPANAVTALRNPTGPLKVCLDMATAAEQSFAMRAAVAARNLKEWLDELRSWDWPEAGGSAGFQEPEPGQSTTPANSPPRAPALTPSTPETPEQEQQQQQQQARAVRAGSESDEPQWIGSLLATDVFDYEKRTAEIARDIEDLEVEDMKRQVLHHHILPLSPPGTPPIPGKRTSTVSVSSLAPPKMDDLTAVVTAIVLQALPLLSRLTRLLDVWRIRLIVLKKIPTLLTALSAAEAAIHAAWNAICVDGTTDGAGSPLQREEFATMKAVVEGKVSKAAQITDFMLDTLDGWEDTIPDTWIDRIDAAERGYSEWVAACERKMRENDWKRSISSQTTLTAPAEVLEEVLAEEPEQAAPVPVVVEPVADVAADAHASMEDAAALMLPETPPRQTLSGQGSRESMRSEPQLPALLPSQMDTSDDLPVARRAPEQLRDDVSDLGDISYLPGEADDDLDILAGPNESPNSSPPNFRASMRSMVAFSDMPTVTEHPDEETPAEPMTPMDSSFVFDELTNEEMSLSQDMSIPDISDMSQDTIRMSSPASISERPLSSDDQLQKQISEILGSIPAKIHLSKEPSPSFSHLNPPDFNMPTTRRPKTPGQAGDGTGARSPSSMSTRSSTPSFLLAPAHARNAGVRSRQQQSRGQQDIKLYHLSRSTGEAPIKLFIRLVGEGGERVMVRVGGGWADLSEYLKEYATHHSRRSKNGSEGAQIEVRDLALPAASSPSVAASLSGRVASTPPSRPATAVDRRRPESPLQMPSLNVRKVRRTRGSSISSEVDSRGISISIGSPITATSTATATATTTAPLRKPFPLSRDGASPPSGGSPLSRPSSRLSWAEEDSSLGMSGPRARHVEMSEESKAWVESVKERVRVASGEQRRSVGLGEMGRVGGTKRLFRRGPPGPVGRVMDK